MEKKKTYTIIMVGDSGIGKTTLASVFVEGKSEFSDIYITTSGKKNYYHVISLFYSLPFCLESKFSVIFFIQLSNS